jgi:hypothetical protein
LIVEHIAVARLSPLTHQVSEYANDPTAGWVMTMGFVAWAASFFASAQAVGWSRGEAHHERARTVVVWALRLAGAAMLITASFHTDTVAGALPRGQHLTVAGRLHDFGSGLTTIALLAAASASLLMIQAFDRWFRAATALAVTLAVVSDIALLLVGRSVGGLRERALIVIGCLWQACLLRGLGGADPSSPSSYGERDG